MKYNLFNRYMFGRVPTFDSIDYEAFVERHVIDGDGEGVYQDVNNRAGKGVGYHVLVNACHMNCKYCPATSYIYINRPYFKNCQIQSPSDLQSDYYAFDVDDVIYQIQDDVSFSAGQISDSCGIDNINDDKDADSTARYVVFGGGEPLLFIDSIQQFKDKCSECRDICVETSLNVKSAAVETGISIFDQWIVDVKTMNPDIYKAYTGFSNSSMIRNLKLLASRGIQDKVLIRLPLIPGFNDTADIETSKAMLQVLGFTRFSTITYHK